MRLPEAFPSKITRRIIPRVFRHLSVDYPQYRTLLVVSLWTDFRGSAQMLMPNQESSALRTAVAIYAVYSLFLSFLAFVLPAGTYAHFILVFGMTILGMVMLIDFGVTLVVPSDIGILGWRPISSRTYFAARLTNALVYILIFGLALFLIPSLFGIFSRGASLAFPLVFLPSALLSGLFAAGLVAASYGALLRFSSQERFRDVVNYLQVALMILLLAGSQLFPRVEGSKLRHGVGGAVNGAGWSWWDVVPVRWFAAPVEMLLDGRNSRNLFLSLAAIASTGMLLAVLIRTLSLSYVERIARAGLESPEPVGRGSRPSRLAVVLGFFLRSPEERAIFDFVRRILGRDRQVRLRLYPLLSYVLLPVVAALLDRRGANLSNAESTTSLLLPVLMMGLLPVLLLSLLPFSGESQGRWIFELTGFEKPGDVAAGIKKCLILHFFLPLALIMAPFFVFLWGALHGTTMVVFALCGGILLLELQFAMFFHGLPFTRPMPAGRSAVGLGYVLVTAPVIGLLVGLARLFLTTPQRLLLASFVLLLAVSLLHRFSNARFVPNPGPSQEGPVQLFS